jgi:hypothetical protein
MRPRSLDSPRMEDAIGTAEMKLGMQIGDSSTKTETGDVICDANTELVTGDATGDTCLEPGMKDTIDIADIRPETKIRDVSTKPEMEGMNHHMICDASWQPGMGYAISRFGTAHMKPGMEIGYASTKPGSRDFICDATTEPAKWDTTSSASTEPSTQSGIGG